MQVIPVLDVQDGQVVQGLAGERERYRPIVSRLCASAEPLQVARAFREHFGFELLYLADLDAIVSGQPAPNLYRDLQDNGFRLMVDAGLRRACEGEVLLDAGVQTLVVGLETIFSPKELAGVVRQAGADRVLFSLDLKGGRPLANPATWPPEDPGAILDRAVEAGVRRVLLLDLARVGGGAGIGTERLARQALAHSADLQVVVGGGVSGPQDLHQLKRLAVHGVLVASALHDGRLTADDLQTLAS